MKFKSFTFDAKKKTIKGDFKPSTAAERQFYKSLKQVARMSGHIIDSHIAGMDEKDVHKLIQRDPQLQKELKAYSEKIGPWASRQSAKLLKKVANSNKLAYQKKSKLMGVALKAGLGDTDVGGVAARLMAEQVALIQSIPLEAGERAQKIAFEAALSGTRAAPDQDTIAELQKQLGLSTEVAESRALLIARTETARATASINQARAMSAGSGSYRWHNSGDGAVRHSHRVYKGRPMQGQIFRWDSPPTLSDGTTTHPGGVYNCRCHPGLSNLTGSPFIHKLFRYRYDRQVTTITLSDGTSISATPNHPIMTRDGFKAIDSLNIGDDIVCKVDQSFDAIEENIESFNITFEQIFNAAAMSPLCVKTSTRGGDFHGDVTDQEVDVISFNGSLISELNVMAREKLSKLGFSGADMMAMDLFFSSPSSSTEELNISSDEIVGRFSLIFPLLQSHLCPLDLFCIALAPHLNPGSDQILPDDKPADPEAFRDLIFAYSIFVHGFHWLERYLDSQIHSSISFSKSGVYSSGPQMFTQTIRTNIDEFGNLNQGLAADYKLRHVVEKYVGDFAVHVYSLQTSSGYYNADTAYTLNCFAEPVFDEEIV